MSTRNTGSTIAHYHQSGLTLIELLVAISMAFILACAALHSWTNLIPRYQIQGAAATFHSLIRQARAEAITDGNRMICDGQRGCGEFRTTRKVWMGHDRNGDGQLDTAEILEYYQLPGKTRLVWKRFKGSALTFHNRGISHFQNGSFYLCNDVAARRIVMNWIGRPRVEAAKPEDCN